MKRLHCSASALSKWPRRFASLQWQGILRASLVSLLLFVAGGVATAAELQGNITCDPVGHWRVKGAWISGACKKKGYQELLDFYLVRTNSGLQVRVTKGAEPEVISVDDNDGACVLMVKEEVNLCAACGGVSEQGYYNYELVERSGSISGKLKYSEESDLNDEGVVAVRCEQSATLSGTKSVFKDEELGFDMGLTIERFKKVYQTLRKTEMCDFKVEGPAKVSFELEPGGGLNEIWVNDEEQLGQCSGRTYLFTGPEWLPNPSGKAQKVAFTMTFPKPSCVSECNENGACTWKFGACRVLSEKDCIESDLCKSKARCSFVSQKDLTKECNGNDECKQGDWGTCERTSSFDCRRSDGCSTEGKCMLEGDSCVAGSDSDCGQSQDCVVQGRCSLNGNCCVVGSAEDCQKSQGCKSTGDCALIAGACAPGSTGDCRRTSGCKENGDCTWIDGACAPGSTGDCRRTSGCKENGDCTWKSDSCVPVSSADCRRALGCKVSGLCYIKDGACVDREATMSRHQRAETAFAKCRNVMAKLKVFKRQALSLQRQGKDYSSVLEKISDLDDAFYEVIDKLREIMEEMQEEDVSQSEIIRFIQRTERECTLN